MARSSLKCVCPFPLLVTSLTTCTYTVQLWHLGRVSHPDAPEQIASGTVSCHIYSILRVAFTFVIDIAARVCPLSNFSTRRKVQIHSWCARLRDGAYPTQRQCVCGMYVTGFHIQPTELPDPWTIIAQYKQAAINAKEAGFDGVERRLPFMLHFLPSAHSYHPDVVHAANGYLVQQFLDNTANQRTDQWGGSYINRCRFGLEALKVLTEVWGADKVGVKLNPAGGYNDVGFVITYPFCLHIVAYNGNSHRHTSYCVYTG